MYISWVKFMNKRFVIVSLLIGISFTCWAQSPYYSGDGGKGMSLAILVPESQGLSKDLAYLPAMVQGCLVSNISKYSGIAVLDRVALDKVIAETLDPTYKDNLDIVRLGHVSQTGHIMTGKLIKTSSLNTANSAQAVNAQTALAQSITAQKQGTVIEALSYYIQASNYDTGLAEAASRMNVLSGNKRQFDYR